MTEPQTPLTVLKAARELISHPAKWTKDAFARNADGVDPTYGGGLPAAPACFCTIGALWFVTGVDPFLASDTDPVSLALNALQATADDLVTIYNDAPERTHAEVLDLFDRTIARLEAEARDA